MAQNRINTAEIMSNLERKAQTIKAHLVPLNVLNHVLFPYLKDKKDVANLSITCVGLYERSPMLRVKCALQDLLQAMIDDDRQTVIKILKSNPELLLLEPKDFGITEIESKLTWQTFLTEKVFIMAQKLKRLEMVKIMLPRLEAIDASGERKATDIPEVVKQWVIPHPLSDAAQKEQEEALQQIYIENHFRKQITTIAADNDANVTWVMNNETKLEEARVVINDNTKSMLKTFRAWLLRKVAIDEYVDIDQFLMAAYKAYDDLFNTFQNWHQRAVYGICVEGFIQTLLSPEFAKAFCESLDDVVNNNRALGALAIVFKLRDGRPFHRASRDSESGQGFHFRCSMFGGPVAARAGPRRGARLALLLEAMSDKHKRVWKTLTPRAQRKAKYAARVEQPSRCVIS